MAAVKGQHVKSASTTTEVEKSRADIMRCIDRYGGTGFGYDRDGDTIHVRFSVPGADARPLRVDFPINIAIVQSRATDARKAQKQGPASRVQAEMIAWRTVYTLVDAAFAAAAVGASSVEEAFHAHLVVTTTDGQSGRMVDYMATLAGAHGELPSTAQVRRMLSAG